MAADEDELDADPLGVRSGPRRSTFTPPPEPGDDQFDDDALADALAASFPGPATGSFPIAQPPAAPAAEPAPVAPAPDAAVAAEQAAGEGVAEPVISAPSAPAAPASWVPSAQDFVRPAEPVASEPEAGDLPEPADQPEQPAESAAAPPVTSEPVGPAPAEPSFIEPSSNGDDTAPPPWASAPAPDPAQAVDLPQGPPQRPVRRSLPDDQLIGWVEEAAAEPGGTLDVIEGLQSQLNLRIQEAREFRDWEQTMLADGTPEAIAAVEEARPEFTGVLPDLGAALGGVAAASAEPAAAPQAEPIAQPEPASSEEPGAEPLAQAETESPVPALPAEEPSEEPIVTAASDMGAPVVAAPPVDSGAGSWSLDQETQDAEADAPSAPATPPDDADPFEQYRPPPGWFVPPVPVDAPAVPVDEQAGAVPPAETVPVDGALQGEPPSAPLTGPFVMPDEQLAAWPAPDFADTETAGTSSFAPAPEEAAVVEDAAAPLVPPLIAAEPIEPEPIEPEPFAPEPIEPEPFEPEPIEPEPIDGAPSIEDAVVVEEAPHFLPEPSSEPLLPTAAVPVAAPPPLVEPPVFGTSGVPTPVAEPIVPAPAAPEAAEPVAPADADPDSAAWFDKLVAGEEPPPGEPPLDKGAETLFIEPLPVIAGGELTETGSVTIVDQAYEFEAEDEAVDEPDRVTQGLGPVRVDTAGIAIVPPSVSPPSGPISTVRVPADETVLSGEQLTPPKVFTLEAASLEPTPVENRIGRAARLFWLWFAPNASLLSIGLGAAVLGLGMNLRQAIVATLAGVALSFFPLGLSTLAGKRSGQPTMVVSRATFGLLGNVVPSILSLLSRLFWGGVLLWFLATSAASVLIGAEIGGGIGERVLQLIFFGGGLALAFVIALFGYGLLAKVQLVLSIVSGILLVGMIAMTASYINLSQALSIQDGPWILVLSGAVLVFSFVGLAWANSGGDLARYQRPGSSGAGSMLWATFGATVPAFILIAYGAVLAASNEGIASGMTTAPLDTIALMLPAWYPIPLILSVVLSLLSGIAITMYSGGFSLQAAGVRVPRPVGVAIAAALVGVLTAVLLFAFGGSISELFRDAATTIAVPIAAWAGIFAAELMIRNRRFETMSLLHRGGIYADVRWGNLIALVVITAVGWGLTTASVGWLSWQGYAFGLLGVGVDSDLAGTDLGVVVALALGILVPIVIGIPGIRRQESTEPPA